MYNATLLSMRSSGHVIWPWILALTAIAAEPRVEMIKKLVLPEAIHAALAEHFPGYRALTQEDYAAADPWDYAWFFNNAENATRVPFACWGDFNGDREMDVALMLTAPARADSQTIVVVFHGYDKGKTFEPLVLCTIGGHSWLEQAISTVDNDTIVTIKGKGYAGEYPPDFPDYILLFNPCIERVYLGKAASVYYWEDGEYKNVQTAD